VPALIRLLVLLLGLGALPPRLAAASPSREFVEARTVFRSGQYGEAIALFNGLLYPTSRLSDSQELADAHLLLAVSYYETGKREFAEREFEEALALRPDLRIEAFGFSRSATEFLEAKKRQIDARARAAAERLREARERQRLIAAVNRLQVKERPNILLNLVPFGVGQFQNGERGRALFFGISELVLGGASVALWAYQLRYANGQVPPDEVDTVRNIQVLQVTTGSLCLAVMGWGVIDAFVRYKGARFRPLTDEEKRDYMRQIGAEPAPRRSSFQLSPLISPEAAGAALSWEF
jgi:tetratricopeptide (TPR) repeat protein